MVSVASPGPPPVKVYILSNIRNVSMVLRSNANIKPGFNKGNVMYLKICNLLAPKKTLAASYISIGMDWRLAKTTKKTNGVHCHISVKIIEARAYLDELSHSIGAKPIFFPTDN